MTYLLRR